MAIHVINHTNQNLDIISPYIELRVGSAGKAAARSEQVLSDATGCNIACKNFAFSELTGLYWIWKNTDDDITGLVHYRRFLKSPHRDAPLDADEIHDALEQHDCLTPKPTKLPRSVASHYCMCHVAEDLNALYRVFANQPETYRRALDELMADDEIIPYNIIIARKDLLDSYCTWLFEILDACECEIDLFHGRDAYQMRVFGFMAERLLNVWLRANNLDTAHHDLWSPNGTAAPDISSAANEAYPDYAHLLDGVRGFDAAFYAASYPDVAAAFGTDEKAAKNHYAHYGWRENRFCSEGFKIGDYLNMRPDLRHRYGDDMSACLKALESEASDGPVVVSRNVVYGVSRKGLIDYSPVYDWLYYTTTYDDVPSDPDKTHEALQHFIEIGIPEGRQGSKGFSLDAYKEAHPELQKRFKSSNKKYYRHYLSHEAKRNAGINWDYVR